MKGDKLFNKTRFAPTPSGFLHIGNAYSFLLTAAVAREAGASILLRIDDLDRERVRKEFVQDIFDTLAFLELEWQEGPANYQDYLERWSQLNRRELYQKYLSLLASQQLVYACDCSRQQLAREKVTARDNCQCRNKNLSLDAPAVNWRLKTAKQEVWELNDWHKGAISVSLPESMVDFVVRKKDGFPSYQLASLVDDDCFGVDLIVRGQDLWDSTLAQMYLCRLIGLESFSRVCFLHHPLISNSQGEKLSKSAGVTSIQSLRKKGIGRNELLKILSGPVSNSEFRIPNDE